MPSVIIIGASSGLGQRIARIYIGRGYRVGIAARRTERLDELTALAPDRVTAARIDITADNAPDSLRQLINAMGTSPDLFINCAGIGFANPGLDPQLDLSTVETNCTGFTRIIDCMFNYYAGYNQPGHIASITSIAGTRGIGIAASYSASKRFQSEYLTALSQLAAQRNLPITITDLQPGFVDTPLLDSSTHYPMMMNPDRAAALIVKVIDRKRHRAVIDRRWSIVTSLWRRIPRPLWRNMRLRLSSKTTE